MQIYVCISLSRDDTTQNTSMFRSKSSGFPEAPGPLAVAEEGTLAHETAYDERGEDDADGDKDGDKYSGPRGEGFARL